MWRLLVALVALVGASGCGARAPVSIPPPSAARAQGPLETTPDRRAAFARAYTLFRRGEQEQALPVFSALAERYPELVDYALYFVGTIASGRGDDATAEEVFARLLRDYPESVKAPGAALELGKMLLRAGRV
jgi:TolA-binding protein